MSVSAIASASIQPGDASQVSLTGTAQGPSNETIPLTGSQTYNVDLAMLPANGAQAWMVRVDMVDASGAPVSTPVRVNFTPGGYRYVVPGGFVAECAPKGSVGVTALQLVSTANAVAHVTVMG